MSLQTETISDYQARIAELESELNDMTVALSQAWDQLVPFLQVAPTNSDSQDAIWPIIQAAMAAVDADLGGVYLLHEQEWFAVPVGTPLPDVLADFRASELEKTGAFQWQESPPNGAEPVQWSFAPVIPEQHVVGVIGVGLRRSSRAFTAADVRIIERMAERAASQIAAARLKRSREREAQTRHEIDIASKIQRSIQPIHAPEIPGLAVATRWHPARHVGGDAWGWVLQPNGHLACFLLDVAGKGLPSALAAVSLHTAIRTGLRLGLSPAAVLDLVNEEFYDAYTRTDLLATAAVLSIDPQTGIFEQANAGHPPTLIGQQGQWTLLPATAPPIGVLPDLDVQPQIRQLNPGDLIIGYSDGYTEIETTTGFWGEQGLIQTIGQARADANLAAQQIQTAADAARAGNELHDDQTLVVVSFKA